MFEAPNLSRGIVHNGCWLCVWAGFEAQSFNLLLKFIRSRHITEKWLVDVED
jgi:hypothetical protein